MIRGSCGAEPVGSTSPPVIMDNVIEKAQKVASGILRAIPMAPVSKHIATWVDDVDIREFQTYHDVGVGLEATADGKLIVARKRPKSSSW